MPRRSSRIRALQGVAEDQEPTANEPSPRKRRKRAVTKSTTIQTKTKTPKRKNEDGDNNDASSVLPRTRELQIKDKQSQVSYVVGIDEAGRGPLAGPVVAAAIIAPTNLAGIIDSKKVTKEDDREALYEQLIATKDVRWAVSIMDAARIDEINILQATLEGMRMACTALVDPTKLCVRIASEPSVDELGCYVIGSSLSSSSKKKTKTTNDNNESYYALVDGNKVPKEMPCPAECMVKGDSREFCIAAASILAKVTRDRLMHNYDTLYPEYNLKQHKGYPTAAHMRAVFEHGASPIHRRTFAPLKHMEFDKHGKIIKDNR